MGLWGPNSRALLIPAPRSAQQLVAAIIFVCCRDVLKADIKISSLNYFRNPLVWASHKQHIFGGEVVSRACHLPPSTFTFSSYSPVLGRIQKPELMVPVSRAAAEACQKCSDKKKSRFSAAPGLLPAGE